MKKGWLIMLGILVFAFLTMVVIGTTYPAPHGPVKHYPVMFHIFLLMFLLSVGAMPVATIATAYCYIRGLGARRVKEFEQAQEWFMKTLIAAIAIGGAGLLQNVFLELARMSAAH